MMRLLAGLLYVAFVLDAGNAQRGVLRRRAVDLEQDDVPPQSVMTKKSEASKKAKEEETVEREGGTTLLLINVQNCHQQGGADDDSKRLAKMILKNAENIDRIIATMDTRDKLHISQPSFWINDDGFHPRIDDDDFIPITSQDVMSGTYYPNPKVQLPSMKKMLNLKYLQGKKDKVLDETTGEVNVYKYAIEYLTRLEASNRFNFTIWPEHCLVGTEGSNMYPPVRNALMEWSEETGRSVEWINNGQNPLTQMLSIMRAEVVVSEDTYYNEDLYDSLILSERLLVAGQAKSHAVNWSLRDVLDWWPDEDASRIALLMDGTSPMKGFEKEAEELEAFLKEKGVQLIKVEDVFHVNG